MATVAGRRKHPSDVVGDGGSLKIGSMARVTLRGHARELTGRCALVAGITVHSSVCSDQREAVRVLLDILNRNLPSADGMALFAISPELTLVNVGVAILATLADIREDRLHVALSARNRDMHTAQRVTRLAVIKFRNRANRPPRICGVAILARGVQVSVGAMRTTGSLRFCAANRAERQQHQRN